MIEIIVSQNTDVIFVLIRSTQKKDKNKSNKLSFMDTHKYN